MRILKKLDFPLLSRKLLKITLRRMIYRLTVPSSVTCILSLHAASRHQPLIIFIQGLHLTDESPLVIVLHSGYNSLSFNVSQFHLFKFGLKSKWHLFPIRHHKI